jgi:hypothetical protein
MISNSIMIAEPTHWLSCSPETYWQLNSPKAGQAVFQINDLGSVQSILSLPILNNYRFAAIKPPKSS